MDASDCPFWVASPRAERDYFANPSAARRRRQPLVPEARANAPGTREAPRPRALQVPLPGFKPAYPVARCGVAQKKRLLTSHFRDVPDGRMSLNGVGSVCTLLAPRFAAGVSLQPVSVPSPTGWVTSVPDLNDADFKNTVDVISKVIDGVGVVVVVVGLLIATGVYVLAQQDRARAPMAYRVYRQQVGKSILLGLEFLVAADIIRTVAVAPTFAGVGVLAIVVAVRTFLSFALDVELSGKWPWQSRPKPAESSS
jgi:uncharacterized membrane protein